MIVSTAKVMIETDRVTDVMIMFLNMQRDA